MKTAKFWMIWNPNGGAPTYRHYTFADAKKEAARLARSNPGEIFHVLESVVTAQVADIRWVEHEATSQNACSERPPLPF